MNIKKPKVKKEILFDFKERNMIADVKKLLFHIYYDMGYYDVLEIEEYDDVYTYRKSYLLEYIEFLNKILECVYIQEKDEEDADEC